MKTFVVGAGLLLLSACAPYYDDGYYGGGYYNRGYYDRSYYSPGYYNDAYYDGCYGPFYDGYWGAGGVFYFSDSRHRWHRDDGDHFRRQGFSGFRHVQGSGMHHRDWH